MRKYIYLTTPPTTRLFTLILVHDTKEDTVAWHTGYDQPFVNGPKLHQLKKNNLLKSYVLM